jgi:hypothetical protein
MWAFLKVFQISEETKAYMKELIIEKILIVAMGMPTTLICSL